MKKYYDSSDATCTLVVGCADSGKNSAYIRPTINNISETSFIVIDRDGEEYKHFNKKDYDVKILDLVHPQKSTRYNPFAYIHNDADVLSMVNSFFTFNINGIKPNSFFDMAERKLLTAFCFYALDKYKEQPDKQNFTYINKILATLHTTDDFDEFFNDFYKLNEEKPAYYYYKEARRCSSDSFKVVAISMGLRLSAFNIPQIADLTAADDFDIENLGNKKTAVFINIPTSDTFLNFIANMFITQALSLHQSIKRNEKEYDVKFILNEFCNIGKIFMLPERMAMLNPVRSGIKIDIIVQSMSQINTLYINDSGAIINNCDRIICMGIVNEVDRDFFKTLGLLNVIKMKNNKCLVLKCKQGQVKYRIAKKIFT